MPYDLQNACDALHQLDFDDGKTLVARGCSFSIGRGDCNDLVNLSAHLSAKHCRLEPTVSSVASGDGGVPPGGQAVVADDCSASRTPPIPLMAIAIDG